MFSRTIDCLSLIARPAARALALALPLVGASAALAQDHHNHLTIDTQSGKIVIRAGYYPDESGFTINSGVLFHDGSPAVYTLLDRLPNGIIAGTPAGDEVLLTSDFYADSGHLDGGDFRYEIIAVNPVGAAFPARLYWGAFDDFTGQYIPSADSSAADRESRSYAVGIGGHEHSQAYALTGSGDYDITLVAWDVAGLYADSDPITLRFSVPCRLDYNLDGSLNPDDIGDFITDYFTLPPVPGPGGYAVICPDNPAPYDSGYKAGYTSDGFGTCSTPNPDNLGDYITDYFLGC